MMQSLDAVYWFAGKVVLWTTLGLVGLLRPDLIGFELQSVGTFNVDRKGCELRSLGTSNLLDLTGSRSVGTCFDLL